MKKLLIILTILTFGFFSYTFANNLSQNSRPSFYFVSNKSGIPQDLLRLDIPWSWQCSWFPSIYSDFGWISSNCSFSWWYYNVAGNPLRLTWFTYTTFSNIQMNWSNPTIYQDSNWNIWLGGATYGTSWYYLPIPTHYSNSWTATTASTYPGTLWRIFAGVWWTYNASSNSLVNWSWSSVSPMYEQYRSNGNMSYIYSTWWLLYSFQETYLSQYTEPYFGHWNWRSMVWYAMSDSGAYSSYRVSDIQFVSYEWVSNSDIMDWNLSASNPVVDLWVLIFRPSPHTLLSTSYPQTTMVLALSWTQVIYTYFNCAHSKLSYLNSSTYCPVLSQWYLSYTSDWSSSGKYLFRTPTNVAVVSPSTQIGYTYHNCTWWSTTVDFMNLLLNQAQWVVSCNNNWQVMFQPPETSVISNQLCFLSNQSNNCLYMLSDWSVNALGYAVPWTSPAGGAYVGYLGLYGQWQYTWYSYAWNAITTWNAITSFASRFFTCYSWYNLSWFSLNIVNWWPLLAWTFADFDLLSPVTCLIGAWNHWITQAVGDSSFTWSNYFSGVSWYYSGAYSAYCDDPSPSCNSSTLCAICGSTWHNAYAWVWVAWSSFLWSPSTTQSNSFNIIWNLILSIPAVLFIFKLFV